MTVFFIMKLRFVEKSNVCIKIHVQLDQGFEFFFKNNFENSNILI